MIQSPSSFHDLVYRDNCHCTRAVLLSTGAEEITSSETVEVYDTRRATLETSDAIAKRTVGRTGFFLAENRYRKAKDKYFEDLKIDSGDAYSVVKRDDQLTTVILADKHGTLWQFSS
eukprot:GHVU01084515.1.p1 GENE.GHVU01084515.1~~GHVU01084515.1.p1  ORF type:complete len:117 (-),score=5.97 GHVU01084515.1:365-715(-)